MARVGWRESRPESAMSGDAPAAGEGHRALAGGRYRLREVLGEGGMARVYLGWDSRLGVERAIKVLAPQLSSRQDLRVRFEIEARTMARLSHPHVVAVQDVVDDGETVFMVMELVRGGSLWEWVEAHGAMPPSLAVGALRPVVEAIGAAHAQGVVHRDIKPQNILLTAEGQPKITDFGIAQATDHLRDLARTRTGAVMGTWGFMSPEQRTSARRVDGRTDIYALGATLWSLVTGQTPIDLFAAEMDATMLEGLPLGLAEVIRTATRYNPDQRYANADALHAALSALMPQLPSVPPGTPRLGLRIARPAEHRGSPPTLAAATGTSFSTAPRTPAPARRDTDTLMELVQPAAPAPTPAVAPTPPAEVRPRSRRSLLLTLVATFSVLGLALGIGLRGPGEAEVAEAPPVAASPEPPPAHRGRAERRPLQEAPPEAIPAAPPVEEPAPEPVLAEAAPAEPAASPPLPTRASGPAPSATAAPVEARPAPEPEVEMAFIEIVGDATSVELRGEARRYPPGPVLPGHYNVLAAFPNVEGRIKAGEIDLKPGERKRLSCSAAFQKCQ
jgi:serine/threonine protein kinase